MKTNNDIPSILTSQPIFNAVRLQGQIPPKPSLGQRTGKTAYEATIRRQLHRKPESEYEHHTALPVADFKKALYARLQQLPDTTVLRHGNENSTVFTVYVPANDLQAEYAVYDVEKAIYQIYNDAQFEVIVEEAPVLSPLSLADGTQMSRLDK